MTFTPALLEVPEDGARILIWLWFEWAIRSRLVGHFEDQGWCDTHTATWNFGDGSPVLSATVEEPNEPIDMRAFNSAGMAVGADTSAQPTGELRTLSIQAPDITMVEIRGGGRGTLSRICLTRQAN